ncbi:pyridoxal phosphate-dependent transferase [Russula compacta]|nr:pyridoxal phosphate-dependent transferase [Russula compacta]
MSLEGLQRQSKTKRRAIRGDPQMWGLAGNETIKERAIETLRKYGVLVYVHMDLERDIADFLCTEAIIIYSQAFSAIPSVISAIPKRGNITVGDRGINFTIQKGLQNSRPTIRWFDHNDLKSLEDVLQSIEKERCTRRGLITRRFIIPEGIFEKNGAISDLPKLIELKHKYKYRLILDENMFLGSVANSLNSSGGFCAGSRIVINHQLSMAPPSPFSLSAAAPALLTVSASEGINILRNMPTILQENIRHLLYPGEPLPIIHIHLRNTTLPATRLHPLVLANAPVATAKPSNGRSPEPRDALTFYLAVEGRLLQDIVDEALAQGVWITQAKQLRGQQLVEARPSIRLAVTAALSRKECERTAGAVKATAVKVLTKRK